MNHRRTTPDHRPRRRWLLAAALGAGAVLVPALNAAEGGDDKPFATVAVPDLTATHARFAETPYQELAQTQWAQTGLTALRDELQQHAPGALDALASIESARFAAVLNAFAPSFGVWVDSERPQSLIDVLTALPDGFAPDEGAADTWRSDDGAAVLTATADGIEIQVGVTPVAGPPALPATEADLHAHLDYAAAGPLFAETGMDPALLADTTLTVELSLDRIGLRERIVSIQPPQPGMAAMARADVDRDLLASLPGDTLWAVASQIDGTAIDAWLASEQGQELFVGNPAIAQADRILNGMGLPAYRELLTALDGPSLCYVRSAAPFPAATLSLGIDEAVGTRLLQTLATLGDFTDLGDGSYQRSVGLAVISAGYRDGAILLTSHPLGLDAHSDREPGFFEHAAIQDALAELPADGPLQMIGLSRSGDWWGGLADLVTPFLGAQVPGLFSLGTDLREAGSHGFLWVQSTEEGARTTIESGGLIGGPMGVAMLSGMAIPSFMLRNVSARAPIPEARIERIE